MAINKTTLLLVGVIGYFILTRSAQAGELVQQSTTTPTTPDDNDTGVYIPVNPPQEEGTGQTLPEVEIHPGYIDTSFPMAQTPTPSSEPASVPEPPVTPPPSPKPSVAPPPPSNIAIDLDVAATEIPPEQKNSELDPVTQTPESLVVDTQPSPNIEIADLNKAPNSSYIGPNIIPDDGQNHTVHAGVFSYKYYPGEVYGFVRLADGTVMELNFSKMYVRGLADFNSTFFKSYSSAREAITGFMKYISTLKYDQITKYLFSTDWQIINYFGRSVSVPNYKVAELVKKLAIGATVMEGEVTTPVIVEREPEYTPTPVPEPRQPEQPTRYYDHTLSIPTELGSYTGPYTIPTFDAYGLVSIDSKEYQYNFGDVFGFVRLAIPDRAPMELNFNNIYKYYGSEFTGAAKYVSVLIMRKLANFYSSIVPVSGSIGIAYKTNAGVVSNFLNSMQLLGRTVYYLSTNILDSFLSDIPQFSKYKLSTLKQAKEYDTLPSIMSDFIDHYKAYVAIKNNPSLTFEDYFVSELYMGEVGYNPGDTAYHSELTYLLKKYFNNLDHQKHFMIEPLLNTTLSGYRLKDSFNNNWLYGRR